MLWGSLLSWDLKGIVDLNWQTERKGKLLTQEVSVWEDPKWNKE